MKQRLLQLATQQWLAWLLCLLAGVLVYAPALGGDLIWDDNYLVRENPFFRSPVLGWETFRHYLFFDSFSTYYRPVQNWSYLFDYWLWRGEPMGYHLTNILLHSGSGILLLELLRRLLPSLLGEASALPGSARPALVAFLVAILWIVHPVHNAAVAYISGRADSLAAFFALLAWLLARRAHDFHRPLARGAAGGGAALLMLVALCSKEIALLWLALFALHTLVFERSWSRRAQGVALAGALAVLAGYAWLHALPDFRAPMESGPALPFEGRGLLMLRALGDYAGLLVWPARLYMERTISEPGIYASVAAWREHPRYEYLSILGLLAGGAALYLATRRWPGQRLRCFGLLWFGVAFLPISNLFPLNAEVAEHWIYLASIGALLLAAGSVAALSPRGQTLAATCAVAATLAFGLRTAERAGDWVNAETFCQRTIAAGGATPRMLGTLASIYGARGEWSRQEAILRRMVAGFHEYAPARLNLGICLSQQGRAAEAEPLLKVATPEAEATAHRFPRTWPAALHLARLRQQAGHGDEAIAILAETRERFPETWELVQYESELRQAQGAATALPMVETFAAAHWWHLEAWVALGRLRYSAGLPEAAIAALEAAARLDIYAAEPLADIARIELERGRPDAALARQLAALRREPGQPSHYLLLGSIYEKLGRAAEASEALRQATALAAAARGHS